MLRVIFITLYTWILLEFFNRLQQLQLLPNCGIKLKIALNILQFGDTGTTEQLIYAILDWFVGSGRMEYCNMNITEYLDNYCNKT
jgi:hypothetical protein